MDQRLLARPPARAATLTTWADPASRPRRVREAVHNAPAGGGWYLECPRQPAVGGA